MNSLLVVIAVTIIVVALLLIVSRLFDMKVGAGRTKKPETRGARPRIETTRWRAVKIKPGLICCSRVSEMSERVYLASESPRLPLDDCGETNCRCKYVHLDDRRSGGDRRVDLGDLGAFLPQNMSERRSGASRRAADLAA